MFKKFLWRDCVFIIVLITTIALPAYIHTNYPQAFSRFFYPVEAWFTKRDLRCSKNAPHFLRQLLIEMIDEQKSLNNQVAFWHNGQLFHCESGWEDGFRGKKPMRVNSRFRYASVSKVLTSALILHAINEQKLSLDSKIIELLELPAPKDPRVAAITIKMLLEHSAGFDRLKTYTPMLTMDVKPWCPTNLAQLSETKLDFDPETQFQYSNVGYCLLGAAIEKAYGRSFQSVAEDYFQLKKYGVSFVGDGFLPDEIQYDYRFEPFYAESYSKHFDFKDSLYAVGGLSGSAADIVQLLAALPKETPLTIFSHNHAPCSINILDACYGYALQPYQASRQSYTLWGKSGFFPGVNTDVFLDEQGNILATFRAASTKKTADTLLLRQYAYSLMNEYVNQK